MLSVRIPGFGRDGDVGMKMIRSALLWCAGGICFCFFFLIVALGLIIADGRAIYPAVHVLARIQLLSMGLRLQVHGCHRFETHRSYLIVGNHESMFDLFAIPAALPMHAVGIEADYHFSIPLWGYLTRKWGNIPITRENRAQAIRALDGATRILRAGTSIVVLPEGHRTLNGQVGPFKKGPFHLALAAGADILPFAVSGLYEYRSKEGWHLSPRMAHVAFGEPIPYESYKDGTVDDILLRVHGEIVALKGDRSPFA